MRIFLWFFRGATLYLWFDVATFVFCAKTVSRLVKLNRWVIRLGVRACCRNYLNSSTQKSSDTLHAATFYSSTQKTQYLATTPTPNRTPVRSHYPLLSSSLSGKFVDMFSKCNVQTKFLQFSIIHQQSKVAEIYGLSQTD